MLHHQQLAAAVLQQLQLQPTTCHSYLTVPLIFRLCCLQGLLTQESLANVPFLVLGNKIDMVGAAQEGELRHVLGLTETTGKDATGPKDDGRRPIELFMCSIMTKRGYAEGFKWLTKFI